MRPRIDLGGLAGAVAAGGIGVPFFCAVRLAVPGVAEQSEARAAPLLALVLALTERMLGPVRAVEMRTRGMAGDAAILLAQAVHDGGGVTQVALRLGAPAALEAELDGDAGALRLDGGRLVRHVAGSAATVPMPAAGGAGEGASERLISLIRRAAVPGTG